LVYLCGRERLPLKDGTHVIAVPKPPDTVRTNDILTIPDAVSEEEAGFPWRLMLKRYSRRKIGPLSEDTFHSRRVLQCQGCCGDDKLINALTALCREDLAVRVEQDLSFGVLLLQYMSKWPPATLGSPQSIPRDDLPSRAEYRRKHEKQSGGSGQ